MKRIWEGVAFGCQVSIELDAGKLRVFRIDGAPHEIPSYADIIIRHAFVEMAQEIEALRRMPKGDDGATVDVGARVQTVDADDVCVTLCSTCSRSIVGIDQGLAACPWCERDALRDRLAKLVVVVEQRRSLPLPDRSRWFAEALRLTRITNEIASSNPRPLSFPRRDDGPVLVSRDPSKPSQWRATCFDSDNVPTGHGEARTFADAVKLARYYGGDVEKALDADDACITLCGTCSHSIVGIDQGLAVCPWCECDTLRDRLAKLEAATSNSDTPCHCQLEAGDSPCPMHGENSP